MSAVDALVGRVVPTGFDIVRVAHVELFVPDLAAARCFYVDLLGLVLTEEHDDVLYLRGWEERHHHSLIVRLADAAAVGHMGFLVRSDGDLDTLEAFAASHGWRRGWVADERAQGRALRIEDNLGCPVEFFHAMDRVQSRLQDFHLQRGAPIMRFDHVNLHVPEVEPGIAAWQELGFRCSEYIATDDGEERVTGAWLYRKPTVHDVALTGGTGPRLHHLAFWVADTLGVVRACDQLAAAGHSHAIERGPGRHGVSNAFFVYLRDPAGHRIELYASDYYTGDPDHRPLRWSLSDPRCRAFWGTRAPDSWYEDSSIFLDLDGKPVATTAGAIDERNELTG